MSSSTNSTTTMDSTGMDWTADSHTTVEFSYFQKLPTELKQMVWNEALPTFDIHRFIAEVAPQLEPTRSKPHGLVLCLKPTEDFIQLTSGYRGLLGACHESREVALTKMTARLPIEYLTSEDDGKFAIRSARVPFSPDGLVCISNLGPALHAVWNGHGARGIELNMGDWPEALAEDIQCVTFEDIKHLAITLNAARDYESAHLFMLGWSVTAFDTLAKRMAGFKLETMEVLDDDWLNERHHAHPWYFRWLHKRTPLLRPNDDEDDKWNDQFDKPPYVKVPWQKLYEDFRANRNAFRTIKQLKA
jgi:hypothetical protein